MSGTPFKRLKQSVTEQVPTLQREEIEKQNKQNPLNKSAVKMLHLNRLLASVSALG